MPLATAMAMTAPQKTESTEVRKSIWSIGLSGTRYALRSSDEKYDFIGTGGIVHIGNGYIADQWFALFSLDVLLGPYEPISQRQLEVDYFGTGVTLWTGFSAQPLNLRSQEGGYGFALGLSYGDTTGRSVGKNHKVQQNGFALANEGLIDNYVMRINNFSLLSGVFFSWLKEARPKGNTPDLLATRLEGYLLMFGVAMPLQATYDTKHDRFIPNPDNPTKLLPQYVREKGRLRGYSLLVSLTTLLGT